MNGIANPVIARFADLQGVIEHWGRRNMSERRIRKLAIENYARVLQAGLRGQAGVKRRRRRASQTAHRAA